LIKHRYQLVQKKVNWADAHRYCEKKHRNKLVVILSKMDQVALMSYIDQLHG